MAKGFVGNAVDTVKSVAGEALQKAAETAVAVVATRAAEGAADLVEDRGNKQRKPKRKSGKKSAPKRKAAAKKTGNKSAKKKTGRRAFKKKRI